MSEERSGWAPEREDYEDVSWDQDAAHTENRHGRPMSLAPRSPARDRPASAPSALNARHHLNQHRTTENCIIYNGVRYSCMMAPEDSDSRGTSRAVEAQGRSTGFAPQAYRTAASSWQEDLQRQLPSVPDGSEQALEYQPADGDWAAVADPNYFSVGDARGRLATDQDAGERYSLGPDVCYGYNPDGFNQRAGMGRGRGATRSEACRRSGHENSSSSEDHDRGAKRRRQEPDGQPAMRLRRGAQPLHVDVESPSNCRHRDGGRRRGGRTPPSAASFDRGRPPGRRQAERPREQELQELQNLLQMASSGILYADVPLLSGGELLGRYLPILQRLLQRRMLSVSARAIQGAAGRTDATLSLLQATVSSALPDLLTRVTMRGDVVRRLLPLHVELEQQIRVASPQAADLVNLLQGRLVGVSTTRGARIGVVRSLVRDEDGVSALEVAFGRLDLGAAAGEEGGDESAEVYQLSQVLSTDEEIRNAQLSAAAEFDCMPHMLADLLLNQRLARTAERVPELFQPTEATPEEELEEEELTALGSGLSFVSLVFQLLDPALGPIRGELDNEQNRYSRAQAARQQEQQQQQQQEQQQQLQQLLGQYSLQGGLFFDTHRQPPPPQQQQQQQLQYYAPPVQNAVGAPGGWQGGVEPQGCGAPMPLPFYGDGYGGVGGWGPIGGGGMGQREPQQPQQPQLQLQTGIHFRGGVLPLAGGVPLDPHRPTGRNSDGIGGGRSRDPAYFSGSTTNGSASAPPPVLMAAREAWQPPAVPPPQQHWRDAGQGTGNVLLPNRRVAASAVSRSGPYVPAVSPHHQYAQLPALPWAQASLIGPEQHMVCHGNAVDPRGDGDVEHMAVPQPMLSPWQLAEVVTHNAPAPPSRAPSGAYQAVAPTEGVPGRSAIEAVGADEGTAEGLTRSQWKKQKRRERRQQGSETPDAADAPPQPM